MEYYTQPERFPAAEPEPVERLFRQRPRQGQRLLSRPIEDTRAKPENTLEFHERVPQGHREQFGAVLPSSGTPGTPRCVVRIRPVLPGQAAHSDTFQRVRLGATPDTP